MLQILVGYKAVHSLLGLICERQGVGAKTIFGHLWPIFALWPAFVTTRRFASGVRDIGLLQDSGISACLEFVNIA